VKAPRKLFRKDLLRAMADEAVRGVPIAAIKRKHELDCALPHLAKHIEYDILFNEKEDVMARLFPVWLNGEEDIQEEDGEYKYLGFFPWGHWLTLEEWLQR